MKRLGIYSLSISHFIETIIYWLSLTNEFEIVLITDIDPESPIKGSEHSWSLKRISNSNLVSVCAYNSVPQQLDWLYIHLNPNNLRQQYCLKQWMQRANKIGMLTDTDYRSLKAVFKELHYHKSIIFRASSCTFQVGSQTKIAYPFIKNRFFYTPSAHPQILWNQVLSERVFSLFQPSMEQRPFKFIFIGNRNPPNRTSALRQIERKLSYCGSLQYCRQYNPQSSLSVSQRETLVLWIEYGDNGPVRGIAPKDFIDALISLLSE